MYFSPLCTVHWTYLVYCTVNKTKAFKDLVLWEMQFFHEKHQNHEMLQCKIGLLSMVYIVLNDPS